MEKGLIGTAIGASLLNPITPTTLGVIGASTALSSCKKEPLEKEYKVKVTYLVTGTGTSFDVTISPPNGGTEQFNNVSSGWKYEWTEDLSRWNSNYFRYVSAQNNGQSGGVKVQILCDGEVIRSNSSSGPYCVASSYFNAGSY